MSNYKKDSSREKNKNRNKSIFVRFKNFILRGNILNFAIGIIIGNAFKDVISGLVDDIIMPLIGMILGKINLTKLEWTLSSDVSISYGEFIHQLVNFIIIALCIFFFCILIGDDPNNIQTKDEAQKAQVEKTNQLLEEIRDALKNNSK